MEFINVKAQQDKIRIQIDSSIKKVLDHGHYIMGPEVFGLEKKLEEFCGVQHAITCSNGTDALAMCLMAKSVGSGDAVFVPSFTFAATAEVVALIGATPVFVDSLPDTYNMDPQSLQEGIAVAENLGLRPKGIITVDLFGQPADYDAIQNIANEYCLWILADGAQSFGATYKGRRVGCFGDMTTTSFFPAKPLGCYGDGGAVFTNDDDLANVLRSLRVHGQGTDKYDNVHIGINGRLDTIQAAILLEKLKIFPEEMRHRRTLAEYYNIVLEGIVETPRILDDVESVWAQYTVMLPSGCDREKLMSELKKNGVPTAVYYIKPLHLQKAYKHYPVAHKRGLPVCETLSQRVLSLPMSGYVSENERCIVTSQLRNELTKMKAVEFSPF